MGIRVAQASWDDASVLFKRAIQPDQWSASLHAAREPLGKLVSRALQNETLATELPGAPDGEYAVLQFESSFEKKKQAIETVTPMRDVDGAWRVSGYFIR